MKYPVNLRVFLVTQLSFSGTIHLEKTPFRTVSDIYDLEAPMKSTPQTIEFERALHIKRIRAVTDAWFSSWPCDFLKEFAHAIESVEAGPATEEDYLCRLLPFEPPDRQSLS